MHLKYYLQSHDHFVEASRGWYFLTSTWIGPGLYALLTISQRALYFDLFPNPSITCSIYIQLLNFVITTSGDILAYNIFKDLFAFKDLKCIFSFVAYHQEFWEMFNQQNWLLFMMIYHKIW